MELQDLETKPPAPKINYLVQREFYLSSSTNVDELKYKSMVKYSSRKSYGMLDFTVAQFPCAR